MNNNTVTIADKNEIVGFLRTLGTASSFVSVRTQTEVRMRKTGNPFVGAVKVTKRSGLINVDFVKAVRRRMAEIDGVPFSETEYTPGGTWYKHVQTVEGKPLPLCVHQTDDRRFYLQFFRLNSERPTFFHKGRQLSDAEVKQMRKFVIKTDKNEYKPEVITLAIDSIREMKARNVTLLNDTVNRLTQALRELNPAQPHVGLSDEVILAILEVS